MWQSPGGSGKVRWPTAATCASKVCRRRKPDSTAASAASSSRAARISGSSTILKTPPDCSYKRLRADVSAAEYHGHLAPTVGVRALDQAGQRDAGGALHHQVLRLGELPHGGGDFGFAHHHSRVDHCLADWKGC